ncbi:MAG TPA: bacillithiol biosynthesis deacetylase BshB1 [Longimicrobiales bacterium]|nr:bacillithiol biosynthesis deacetylase BshB1 [Longimicrobiales bacterium]
MSVPATGHVDVLAICAHPDDAELLCGGLLLRCADQGYRTGVLDLTRGELGSAGSPELRAREASRAAEILGLAVRRNAELPDAHLRADLDARWHVAGLIRELRPDVVILQSDDHRNPDHGAAGTLAREAAFSAGLRNAPVAGDPHRPRKLLHGLTYREHGPWPTFVVDVSDQMERKLEAIMAYESQFGGRTSLGGVRGGGDRPIAEQIRAQHAHYGSWIRRPYGEPYWTRETVEVDDVLSLGPGTF